MSKWYYRADDSNCEVGPVSTEELKRLTQQRAIRPDMLLRREDMDRYVRAAKVRGLFTQRVNRPWRMEQSEFAPAVPVAPRATPPALPQRTPNSYADNSAPARPGITEVLSTITLSLLSFFALVIVGCLAVFVVSESIAPKTIAAQEEPVPESSEQPKESPGKATLAAWNEMHRLEQSFELTTPANYMNDYDHLANQLARIDKNNVDPLLSSHIEEKVRTLRLFKSTWNQYIADVNAINKCTQDAADIGAAWGHSTSKKENANANALLCGLFTGVVVEMGQTEKRKSLHKKYEEIYGQIGNRVNRLCHQDATIASQLEDKYGLDFGAQG